MRRRACFWMTTAAASLRACRAARAAAFLPATVVRRKRVRTSHMRTQLWTTVALRCLHSMLLFPWSHHLRLHCSHSDLRSAAKPTPKCSCNMPHSTQLVLLSHNLAFAVCTCRPRVCTRVAIQCSHLTCSMLYTDHSTVGLTSQCKTATSKGRCLWLLAFIMLSCCWTHQHNVWSADMLLLHCPTTTKFACLATMVQALLNFSAVLQAQTELTGGAHLVQKECLALLVHSPAGSDLGGSSFLAPLLCSAPRQQPSPSCLQI